MVHIKELKTSRDPWQKLRAIYASPSTAHRIQLCERLVTSRLMDGDESNKHVEYLERNRTQLRVFGVETDDTLYKLALLGILSTKLDRLSVALETLIDS